MKFIVSSFSIFNVYLKYTFVSMCLCECVWVHMTLHTQRGDNSSWVTLSLNTYSFEAMFSSEPHDSTASTPKHRVIPPALYFTFLRTKMLLFIKIGLLYLD